MIPTDTTAQYDRPFSLSFSNQAQDHGGMSSYTASGYVITLSAAQNTGHTIQKAARINILTEELKKVERPLAIYGVLTLVSMSLATVTKYWIIGAAIFMPVALRYLSHVFTIKIALKRARTC